MDGVGQQILRAATELLSTGGAPALRVRRIAEIAGVSTMGVYSRFGGKLGVVEALYLEGFAQLRAAIESVSTIEDPHERLRALASAYRGRALEGASHYNVMFGRAVPTFEPSAGARDEVLETFQPIVDAARHAVDRGALEGRPRAIAIELWALVHGHVSLELSGDLPTGEEGERRMIRAIDNALRGLAPGGESAHSV